MTNFINWLILTLWLYWLIFYWRVTARKLPC